VRGVADRPEFTRPWNLSIEERYLFFDVCPLWKCHQEDFGVLETLFAFGGITTGDRAKKARPVPDGEVP